jgi:hypothetical protein
MRSLRHKLRVALAWLTATTLLVAATPHFRCVCPNGQVKRFCLNLPSGPTGCCCGGSCCAGSQGGQCCCQAGSGAVDQSGSGRATCCARQGQREARQPAGPDGHLRGACCTKTPASDFLAITSAPETGPESPSASPASFVAPASATFTSVVACWGPCRLSWQSHELPPPTDLVTALQRLTI